MVSLQERNRRYDNLRRSMEEAGLEILIIAGRPDDTGRGFVRYVSNWHMWHCYVVFPIDRDPILVAYAEWEARGAREIGWIEDCRVNPEPAAKIGEILEGWGIGKGVIGVAGLEQFVTVKEYEYLTQQLPGVEFREAKEVIDRVRRFKSVEEIAEMEEWAVAVAAGLRRLGEVLAPGRTERQVAAAAYNVVRERGCIAGFAHITNKVGPWLTEPSDRVIAYDDTVKFIMEVQGPSGYWMEGSGIWSFREPPPRQWAQYETALKAFKKAASMMKPGAIGGEIVAAIEATFREDGWENGRWLRDMHSIGLDSVEGLEILSGDKTVLKEGMVLNLHPGLLMGEEKAGYFITDNFAVTLSGGRQLSNIVHQWNIVA